MANALSVAPGINGKPAPSSRLMDDPYRQMIVARSSLVGFWPCDAVSGTSELDQSGNGNVGTITGGVTLNQPGALVNGDSAMLFDGSTGEIQIGSACTVTGACSFEAWTFDTSGALADIKAIFSLNLGSELFTMNASKQLRLSLNLSSGQKNINGATVLTTNVWNHVVGTFDGADMITLYLNGVQDAQTSGLAGTLVAPAAISRHIGTDGNAVAARFWQGKLANVAFYSAALTAAQVARDFQVGMGRVGVWGPQV